MNGLAKYPSFSEKPSTNREQQIEGVASFRALESEQLASAPPDGSRGEFCE
jgi:hypothetical protein